MLVRTLGRLSRAAIRKRIVERLGTDDADVAVDMVLGEIDRRSTICGKQYPYSQDAGGIRFEASKRSMPYLFMLCLCTSGTYRSEHRYNDTDVLFDSLVGDSVRVYSGGRTILFGSPARGGRPANFKDALVWLGQKLGLESGRGKARKHSGDGGLDVVAWRAFEDERSAFLVMLVQCTVQRDWFGKAKDLAEDVWRGWIDFGKDPHLALAISFVVSPKYEKWDELRRLVHSVLDRLRLCVLLDRAELTMKAEIGAWAAEEVVRMGS